MEKITKIKKSSLAPTILISGGAGFIGSHLAEALLLKDANVIVLDNFSTGKKENLAHLISNPKFTLVEGDINDGVPDQIESVDYIFHLASVESYIYSKEVITLDALLTNALGTKNLLDFAKNCGAKFLLVSSINVFQGQIGSYDMSTYFGKETSEEKMYTHSEAKRFAEALVFEYFKRNKTDARIVRLPEVYGARMDLDSCAELGRLIKSTLNDENLTVYGEGLEKNYYLYIADAISGIVKAQFTDGTKGKIYSLVDNSTTTLELTYMLKSLANREMKVNFKESKKFSYKEVSVNNTDTFRDLKWTAKTELKDGIAKTLKAYDYEFNTHTFKPAKFIENKKQVEQISSLVGFEEAPVVERITSIAPRVQSEINSEPKEIKRFGDTSKSANKNPIVHVTNGFGSGVSAIEGFLRGGTKNTLLLGVSFAVVAAFLVFAALPVGKVLYFGTKAYESLDKSIKSLDTLNLDQAKKSSDAATIQFTEAENSLADLSWAFLITGQEERLRTYAKILKVAEYSSSAISKTAEGSKPLVEIWNSVKPNSKTDLKPDDISRGVISFKKASEDLERAQAELKDLNEAYLPSSLKAKASEIKTKVPDALSVLDTAKTLTGDSLNLLGYERQKKYLVLFQNPTELRSNGGFIGSYAVVTLDKGKIKELTIDDIYNVDGLLDVNGLKTPSYAPVKKYLKQDNLRIRDANFSASFDDSAKVILDLFEKANGTKFDGVFAVDTYLVKDFLKTLGPVYLTAYNEEINSENLYEKTQYHAEADYVEGSQQKKAFLTILGSKILETIFSTDKSIMAGLSRDVLKNLNEKHVLIYLPNTQSSLVVSKNGWDGKVNSTKSDFLMILDNNFGANKSDYFIKREASYKVKNTYRDGSLEILLTLNYEHTGQNNNWPGGPYTDYVKVLVPNESFLHKATILSNGSELDITKDIITQQEAGRKTFETVFILNPGQKTSITYNYTLPSAISLGKGESIYSLYWQKQPGTDETPISIEFEEPFGKEVISTTPEFKETGNIFKLNATLKQDFKALIQTK